MTMENGWELRNQVWCALALAKPRGGSLDHALEPLIAKHGQDEVMRCVTWLHAEGKIEALGAATHGGPDTPKLSVTRLTAKGMREAASHPCDE